MTQQDWIEISERRPERGQQVIALVDYTDASPEERASLTSPVKYTIPARFLYVDEWGTPVFDASAGAGIPRILHWVKKWREVPGIPAG